jgi:glycosyltransferase involved in cell wall biosynthesis
MTFPSLSLVLPCFNEAGNIGATLRDIDRWARESGRDVEIIAVNDGSTDDTAGVLERAKNDFPTLRVVTHPRNLGYASALCTGLDAATGEIIGFMDSDGQFHAKDLDLLLPKLEKVPFVTGRRLKRADPLSRIINAKVSGMIVWVMLGVWVRDINCGMKIFRRELWPRIRPNHVTGALFNSELFLHLKEHKIPWVQVPVPHYKRLHGTQTGGSPMVLLRALRELWQLKRKSKKS